MQEILVLGSNTLSQLRDRIYCVYNRYHPEIRSGYFYIENGFYSDMRDPEHSIDYTANVLEWIRQQRGIDEEDADAQFHLERREMSEVTFSELTVCQ